ncbi:MAG: hypothetical protein CMQ12_07635 [Gammaproteobacteria bacterium]|nr:hypothetical protein [Gammaproteobacteria bacterium]
MVNNNPCNLHLWQDRRCIYGSCEAPQIERIYHGDGLPLIELGQTEGYYIRELEVYLPAPWAGCACQRFK